MSGPMSSVDKVTKNPGKRTTFVLHPRQNQAKTETYANRIALQHLKSKGLAVRIERIGQCWWWNQNSLATATAMPSMSAFVIDSTGVNWALKHPLESFRTSYGTEAILFLGGGGVLSDLSCMATTCPYLRYILLGGHATRWPHGMSDKLTRVVPRTLVYA